MWSDSYVTCVDIIAKVSSTWWSIQLDEPTLNLSLRDLCSNPYG